MQEKNPKQVKMSFIDYYELIDKLKPSLRDEIIKALGIKIKTFYNKMNHDSWSQLEREKLEQVYHEHINVLVSNIAE
jgi:hypothetical protein